MKNSTKERLLQKLKQSNKEKLSKNLAELKELTGDITSFNSSQLVSIDNIVSFFTRLEDDSIINSYCKDLVSYLKNYDIQLITTLSSNRVNIDISLKFHNLESLYAKIYAHIQSYSSEEYNKYFYDVNSLGGFALLNILCKQNNEQHYQNSEDTKKIDQYNFCFLLLQKAREIYSFPEDQGKFTKLLQYYGINLSRNESNQLIIIYKNQQSIISNIYSIATDILDLWKAGEKQKAENTFKFIKAQGLDINCSQISQNILFAIINLTKNTKDLPIDLLETLINLGSNPTILIRDSKNNVINLLTFAISITNLELVNFLLDKGLLPLFDVDPISGCPQILVTGEIQTYINDKSAISVYLNDISKLIDASLINRLSKIYASRLGEETEPETNTNTITIEASDLVQNLAPTEVKKKKKKKPTKNNSNVGGQVKKSQEDSKLNDDSKSKELTKNDVPDNEENLRPNNEVVENTKVSIAKQENNHEEITSYIAFKDNSSRNNDLPEEERLKHEFDTALLKGDIGKTNKLLEKNPHLYSYSLASLIKQNTPESLAGEVLSYNPKILNEYFRLKKAEVNKKAVTKTKNTDVALADNVYEVESLFGGRIFCKISDKISDKILDQISSDDINKLSDLAIISASSKGKNGIKFYKDKGIYKLKLGSYDESAYATKMIANEANDILITFDKWGNHSWFDRQINHKIQVDKVSNAEFQNFMISSYDINNLEGTSGHSDSSNYSSTVEEKDFIPLLGEE